MKKKNSTLPDWFNGTIYDEGDTITNPFSGESYDLNAAETSMYDLIMGINYVGDHRGYALFKLVQLTDSWWCLPRFEAI